MKDIDWSEAPDGTTHFWPGLFLLDGWYKVLEGDVWVYDNGWVKSRVVLSDINTDYLIKRPESWGGETHPPVGTVCEVRLTCSDLWGKARIKYITKTTCVFVYVFEDDPDELEEYSVATCYLKFRPIKTPEQLALEEREKITDEMYGFTRVKMIPAEVDIQREVCDDLYTAGYRLTGEK
ncbi:hypothetical protein [Sulfurovum sp.]|uniref:hypothetical protein n=1 Tax=Sulfurovum sp. TaxID=1969726 RepID=UPI0035677C16